MLSNLAHYFLRIVAKLLGTNTNGYPPQACGLRVASLVARQAKGLEMMLAIDLDDQPMFVDGKIGDVFSHRRLTAYVNAIQAPEVPELAPQPSFTIGHATAQSSRAGDCGC